MAHRLPPAGVSTPESEHYVNYIVIPKPSFCSVPSEAPFTPCSMRPKFVCLSQPPAQSSYKCVDLSMSPCPPSPLGVECVSGASCHHHPKQCLPKPCPCPCCGTKEVNIVSPICCLSAPDCCCEEGHTCAIKITLPRSDDRILERNMKRKLKKLMTDVKKFDQALTCLESKKLQTIQCAPDLRTPQCCCYRHKPAPVRDLCCVPRVPRTKPVPTNCRPFYGKKKTVAI